MAAPSSSGDPLQAHFQRCLVQVLVGGKHSGTGFFVAPGTVLSCAHVVDPEQQITVYWAAAQAFSEAQRLPVREDLPVPDL